MREDTAGPVATRGKESQSQEGRDTPPVPQPR
jgi:hypothetical protein